MPSLGEIVSTAKGLLDQLGPGADEIIALRARAHKREHDDQAAAYWNRVVSAIRAIKAEEDPRDIQLRDAQVVTMLDESALPSLLLRPDLKMVGANPAYYEATMTCRNDLIGCNLFDVFPGCPDEECDDAEAGVAGVVSSMERVLDFQKTDFRRPHRFDLRDGDGKFVTRWWQTVNAPVFDERGRLTHILHRARDVTAQIARRQAAQGSPF
ncbi:MAG TPA: PAS domain-containing protein [Rhizomicrobium sp.]|nr:PAS domain-containing protein [Rhizomicrobium sp.]